MTPPGDASARVARSLRAYDAQHLIDIVALRVAPALTSALIVSLHLDSVGLGAVVFVCMLAAAQLVERSRFPLELLPAARVALAAFAPVLGAGLVVGITAATGKVLPLADLGTALAAGWLVLSLGTWIKLRLETAAPVRLAVIGTRAFAADLAHELGLSNVRGYEVAGWIGAPGSPADNDSLRWLGSLMEVRSVVQQNKIELLVCAPGDDLAEGEERAVFEAVADFCLDLPVRLIAANQLYEQLLGHVPIGTIDAAWFRYIMHPLFRATPPISKRAFDVVAASFIGLLFAPVLIVAAIAMKLRDPGPILYRQSRVGEHGAEFEILKLRSMRVDAEANGMPRWAQADDDRVTPIGRILRRTHVDELPQLWNVLRGEMTLVGPRPERPELVADIEQQFPHYTRRHLVKPGLAGWAQLRCGYAGSELGTAWKLCHDLYYVKHRSILGDALILLETAIVTFRDAHRSLRSPGERFILRDEPNG